MKRIVVVALRLSVQRTIAPLATDATGVFWRAAANVVGLMLSPVSLTAAGNGSLSSVTGVSTAASVNHARQDTLCPWSATDGR